MINKVSIADNFNIRRVNFKSEQGEYTNLSVKDNFTTNPISPEDKGLEALAAYNRAMAVIPATNKATLDIEPLKPLTLNYDNINEVEGEKIYDSEGKLYSVVRRDEKTETTYFPNKDIENAIEKIEVRDKASGNKLLISQIHNFEDGKFTGVSLNKYNPQTNIVEAYTKYDESFNPQYASKAIYDKNGNEKGITKDFEWKEYNISFSTKDDKAHSIITFDKNKNVKNFYEYTKHKGHTKNLDVNFYNGAPYSIRTSTDVTLPNFIGWEKFAEDKDLVPAKKYQKPDNLGDIEGEKTYYSNGALESNTFDFDDDKVVAHFRPDGFCDSITTDNRTIEFGDESEVVTEHIDDETTKVTRFDSFGTSIEFTKGDSYKIASYSKEHRPSSYSEGVIKDGDKQDTLRLYYDEKGMLDWARVE